MSICFQARERKYWCLHGDKFDDFIYNYPNTSKLADNIYRLIQKFDKRFLPRLIKNRSKIYLRCSENMMNSSRKYALEKNADIVLFRTHASSNHK
jgi:UDP-2,3-diacylglucosamine pyrophosphatase LpxH